MIERTAGLILRTYPLTETSLIVHWLTPDVGRISTVAKGARRPKSPFRGKLDLFYRADFSFVRSRSSTLHTLREVDLRETHPALRHELAYLQQVSYCARLIEQTTETDTPLPRLFELLTGLLCHLPRHPPQAATVFAFELKLLRQLGQEPKLPATPLSAGARQVLSKLIELDWPAIARLKPSAAQSGEIDQFLQGIMQLGRMARGRTRAIHSTHSPGH